MILKHCKLFLPQGLITHEFLCLKNNFPHSSPTYASFTSKNAASSEAFTKPHNLNQTLYQLELFGVSSETNWLIGEERDLMDQYKVMQRFKGKAET